MQKLPEASDRKKGRRMHKEKGTTRQKEENHFLFSNDRQVVVTLRVRHWTTRWLVFSLVAPVSVNSLPKYKKLRNGPIKVRTKTVDLDELSKATNTLLKL